MKRNVNIQCGLKNEWYLWDGDDWRGPWRTYAFALEAYEFLVIYGDIPENL